jgi:hypothetical protein
MTRQTSIGGIQTELIDYSKLTKPVTVEVIDAIVTDCLHLLDLRIYRFERQPYSESFVYTVYKNDALLGRFRVWRRDDTPTPVRYGVFQFSDTSELEREWEKMVFGFLYVDIARRVEALDATPTKPNKSEPPAMQVQSEAGRVVNERGESNAILHRIDEMHSDLGEKLDDIKRVEVIIYERIGSEAQSVVNSIWSELREQAISQGEMQRMLGAIRRALKYALQKGLPVDDPAIKQSLEEIYKAVNSNTSIKQQLELSVPVVPFLLEYKVVLDAGVDLGAVWKEWTERVQKNKNN